MPRFLVDLHIHTLLSPCGDLDMSPAVIVRRAAAAGLDAIAITDHNTTLQAAVIRELAREQGITVFWGAELTTREEAHCLAFMPDQAAAAQLQTWIDANIVRIPNSPEKLGDQVWVDADEQIAGEVEWYLNAPIDCSIEQVADEVVGLGGLFVPAHVDRIANSVISQLGFLAPHIPAAAIEYNHQDRFADLKNKQAYLKKYTAYTASDAHFPEQIATRPSWLYAEGRNFGELRKAFAGADGRRIVSAQEEQ